MGSYIDLLNRRLGDRLGLVCGGSLSRFAWKYAPDQPHFVYDLDDRSLIKKSWASFPAPDGSPIGKVWLLAQWTKNKTVDHFGYGTGLRVPVVREFGYAPYIETALAPGQLPTEALTANYIWAIDFQLSNSLEFRRDSFEAYMTEERYKMDANEARDKRDWRETAAAGYDEHTGAMGNCAPGTRGGYLSFGGI